MRNELLPRTVPGTCTCTYKYPECEGFAPILILYLLPIPGYNRRYRRYNTLYRYRTVLGAPTAVQYYVYMCRRRLGSY